MVSDVTPRRRTKINGSLVKALREALGLTQRDLAEKTGVEQRTVARWEQTKDNVVVGEVDYIVWLGILNAYDLDANWQPGIDDISSPSVVDDER